jgi:benzylsuccinate CoA-transferase BbsE subunit
MAEKNEGMLSPYRVLDLTDERGYFGAKLLGDLGADVIKIEKPGGDPGRRLGPFFHDEPGPEKSLYWLGFTHE